MCFAWADSSVPVYNVSQQFCTASRRMKFATKPIRHYPPHLRYIATLPWEIKKINFLQIFSRYGRKCILSPLDLLFVKGESIIQLYNFLCFYVYKTTLRINSLCDSSCSCMLTIAALLSYIVDNNNTNCNKSDNFPKCNMKTITGRISQLCNTPMIAR